MFHGASCIDYQVDLAGTNVIGLFMSLSKRKHPVLIIDRDRESLDDCANILSVEYPEIQTCASLDSVPENWNDHFGRNALLVVSEISAIDDLSKHWRPMESNVSLIGLSRFQEYDVVFRRSPHGSHYCLPKPVCPDTLLLIARIVLNSSAARVRRSVPIPISVMEDWSANQSCAAIPLPPAF